MEHVDIFDRAGAKFSDDRKRRYILYRIWDHDRPKLMFICCNPSIGNENFDDRTITKIIKFCASWGYGGFYLCNLYSWIATDPKDLRIILDSYDRKQLIDEEEQNELQLQVASSKCYKVVFAWGTIGSIYQDRVSKMKDLFPTAWCIEKTKDGHPKHPLFIKGDKQLIPFTQTNKI